jgi:IS30 family transposase
VTCSAIDAPGCQISRRLVLDFPDDQSMRVSHETIYLSISQPARKALPPRLHRQLHTGRLTRLPLLARQPSRRGRTEDMVPIQRPARARQCHYRRREQL